ncbi:MAG: Cof-type HAD-IIB family hydrolase [Anaerolineales bacterium]
MGNKQNRLSKLDSTPVQLLAVDIDGTLLDSHHQVRPRVRKALQNVSNDGLIVSLVTGRPRCATLPLLEDLGLTAPDITSGGAYIFDSARDHVVAYQPLLPETARAVVQLARRPEVGIYFGSPDNISYEIPYEDFHRTSVIDPRYLHRASDLLVETDLQPGKITLVADYPILKDLESQIRTMRIPLELTYSGDRFLEINRAGVDKGSALKSLSEYLGIPLEGVVAVGDSPNDISMLRVAGVSVAMGNAASEVRQAADLVAPSNDEDGVAWLMEKIG